jgi:hypothetical protein
MSVIITVLIVLNIDLQSYLLSFCKFLLKNHRIDKTILVNNIFHDLYRMFDWFSCILKRRKTEFQEKLNINCINIVKKNYSGDMHIPRVLFLLHLPALYLCVLRHINPSQHFPWKIIPPIPSPCPHNERGFLQNWSVPIAMTTHSLKQGVH